MLDRYRSLGAAALERPEIVREAADRFGSQCVVVPVDCRAGEVCTHSGMFHFTEQTPMEAKQYLAEQGFPVRV